ncbi:glycosyltransferase family 2 protein [Vibrio alfacsensis]|uniref:glycosyltransferase family 2 protein n=1 Tax=Vibrio alfacsensis TaxID=1074311 RepID=UPI001BEFDE9E|nr:glycosyltransferase family 2 protein [Vibrio alfacsensis]BCN27287.1 family 2 glycosyl transferase [Vibrio alfacsensis]
MKATLPNLTLSIVVPIYNVEAYLAQCLHTLVEISAIGRYEVILVDDCGQDSSMVIAENYLHSYPNIFKLVKHDKNQGIAASRNSGLAEVVSPYIMFIDSDDWLSKHAITELLDVLIRQSPDFLFFDFTREWENHHEDMPFAPSVNKVCSITEELYFSFLQKIPVTSWGKVFRTEIAKSLPFTKGIIFEDVAIIPSMILRSDNKLYLPGIRYHYRQRDGSIMAERRGEAESLFNAYRILSANQDDARYQKDIQFVLIKDWLINIRVAYHENKHQKAIDLLDKGIKFLNQHHTGWHRNEHLIKHLSSGKPLSKVKVKILLSSLGTRAFNILFLLHINYQPFTWSNARPLVHAT